VFLSDLLAHHLLAHLPSPLPQGEVYPLGWPDVSSHFGILDLAGFPKDSAGYYQAWWRSGPAQNCSAVYLSPTDWTAPVPIGAPVDVFAFSCAAAIGLAVNGVSQGSPLPVPPFGYVTWPGVTFTPGTLTATAYDEQGHALGSMTVLTAGPPAALRLDVSAPYRTPRNASVIAADGQDAALLELTLVDAAGTLQPVDAVAVTVTFTVTSGPGVILGTSSGDPADHVPGHSPSRTTFHGRARAVVASAAPAGQTGPIVVTASAAGFADATVTITAA
jgi:beta-galactosidase